MEARTRARLVILIAILSLSSSFGASDRDDPAATEGARLFDSPRDAVAYERAYEFLSTRDLQSPRDAVREVARQIVVEARRTGLDVELILAVIHVESSGDPNARSRVGAIGLMQVRPGTARAIAREIGVEWRGHDTLYDPVANVRLGSAYLGQLVERFGDLRLALSAYNAGPTRVAAQLRRGEDPHPSYAERVLEHVAVAPI